MLAAWGITSRGRKVLLGLMAGSKEDHETVCAFFQDMRAATSTSPCLWSRTAPPAPSRVIARDLAGRLETEFGRSLPSAVACFLDDFEACIAHLRMPVNHRRAIRTTNLLERLFVEERRRLKIIPNAWGERAILKLMFGAMIRASERWRSVRVTHFERLQMEALRKELDGEYRERTGPVAETETGAQPRKLSSKNRT